MKAALQNRERVLVALDTTDVAKAADLAQRLSGCVGGIKLGKEFFTANGPEGVRRVSDGIPFFLDLKFHDIPNTVAGAIRAAVGLGPFMINVHCAGGRSMIAAAAAAARESAAEHGTDRPLVIGVTVLTSLDADDLDDVGQGRDPAVQVLRLARLAQDNGLDGVVCSPQEISALRAACGRDFLLVVPGIRPTLAVPDDQKRVTTPAEAVQLGADYLVIGRPITGAPDPISAAARIAAELA